MKKYSLASIGLILLVISLNLVSAYTYNQGSHTITQTIKNKPNYYVNQLSTVDLITDKGSHSDFTAQQFGPESIYDVLSEAYTGTAGVNLDDFVDDNSGNVDGTLDKGTESSFANMQSAPDSAYNTLTEADQDAGTSNFGKTSGSGTLYVTPAANVMYLGVYTAGSTGEITGIAFYGRGSTITVNVKSVICDSSGNILTNGISNALSVSTTAGTKTTVYSAGSRPTVESGTTYWLGIIPSGSLRIYYQSTTGASSKYDSSNSYNSPTSPTDASSGTYTWRLMYANINNLDYELDQEYRWTNANYTQTNEELCIKTGNLDSESIQLQIWTGSWATLTSELTANSWNNFTITSYLTSSTLNIRFVDSVQSNDPTQSTWQIDSVLLHTWTSGSNYEVDLEVQWINVDFSEANEYLCIYADTLGSESLMVDFWTGSIWQNLIPSLTSGWNNVTISSYLGSSTFTIRFHGSIETADATQDSWSIDASVLHLWT